MTLIEGLALIIICKVNLNLSGVGGGWGFALI